MAVYFLLGFVLGIIVGAFLYELMRGLVTIILRKRAKRSLEELIAADSGYYRPLDIASKEEKPN